MLSQIVKGYQPVVLGAFALDALLAAKNVFASFGLSLSAAQSDAVLGLCVLVVALVTKEYTISRKFMRDGAS